MTLPPDPPSFLLTRGDARLVVSVPHAGTFVPPALQDRLSKVGKEIVDTDWHVDKLYGFVTRLGATLLVATHSRTVVDLNRDPAGTLLYPGQAETTICPTETFDGEALYAISPPDAADIAKRIQDFWQPYHGALSQELERIKSLHGTARLLDAHSIRQCVPRLFAGKLPDLNFGTNSSASADSALITRAVAATKGSGFTQVLDGRFRGGYITRHYGKPNHGIHAIQLELAQTSYMDEATPETFDAVRAGPLVATLERLTEALLDA